jgi:hypothetical protein
LTDERKKETRGGEGEGEGGGGGEGEEKKKGKGSFELTMYTVTLYTAHCTRHRPHTHKP